jgi:hypothetical protein
MCHTPFDKSASDLLTPADAARIAGVTPATIRQAARSGRLPTTARTAGGIHLFVRKDAERFAEDRKRKLAASARRDERQGYPAEPRLPFDGPAPEDRG